MRNQVTSLWSCVVGVFLVVTMLFGCTQSPENSPFIRKKIAELTTLQEEVADLKDQMLRLSSENEALKEEIRALKERPVGKSSVDASEIKRLNEQIIALTTKLSRLEKELSARKKTTEVATISPPPPPPSATETREKPKPGAEITEETYAKPTGFWYTIQKGDTLEKIAERHNVTVNQILAANYLPKNPKILVGQQIFIPKAK